MRVRGPFIHLTVAYALFAFAKRYLIEAWVKFESECSIGADMKGILVSINTHNGIAAFINDQMTTVDLRLCSVLGTRVFNRTGFAYQEEIDRDCTLEF